MTTQVVPGSDAGGSGIPSAIFNLANTIMGAGLTGLPFVMKNGGVIPFLVFITISAIMGYVTLSFLVTASGYVPDGKKDYQAVGHLALGINGLRISAFATVLSCYGALVSYFVLVGTTAPVIIYLWDPELSIEVWQVQLAMGVCVIAPLCFLKDISALAPTSLFALIVFVLMACTSVASFAGGDDFYTETAPKPPYNVPANPDGVRLFPEQFGFAQLSKFPALVMAFNCQYAMLPIVANLRDGRPEDMRKVCVGGMAVAYVVYVVHALAAYLAFAGDTKDMILLNYRHCYRTVCQNPELDLKECPRVSIKTECLDERIFVEILNGLFLFAVLMGYPCVHFALRRAQIAMTVGVDAEFTWSKHLGLACFNVALTFSIAFLVGDAIVTVFAWTGAVASPLIGFILPSLFYYIILGRTGLEPTSPERLKGLGVLAYGLTEMAVGVTCLLNS